MKDKKLREFLGLYEHADWGLQKEEGSIMEKLSFFARASVVSDYFKDCPCCTSEKYLIKSEAVSFKKIYQGLGFSIETHYTTKESYETHKSQIKKWEKEIEDYKKLRK